jgi:phosphomannomutase
MTLRERLTYEPRNLGFGTSGRRGEVVHLTQLEIYLNSLGELEYLQSLPRSEGGIVKGEAFYFAHDLRPSSTGIVEGRGGIAQAIVAAMEAAGMTPVNLGAIPTPALTYYALSQGKGSIMVTGSHIPFDRNGYKLNTSIGELLKDHEGPVNESVAVVRNRLYGQNADASLFNPSGMFKSGHRNLPSAQPTARRAYIERYTSFFKSQSLAGLRLMVYQHSAVGRDLLVDLLRELQAKVIPAGRREDFVAIDTENIQATQVAAIQKLVDEHGPVDAVISADGDSDRPLLLGVTNGKVKFFPGDLLGMVTAEYLQADAVVVPVSSNDAVERGQLAAVLEPKARIGSPYVIAGMAAAAAKGRKRVCGWEPNGGFLVGSDMGALRKLATRDAVLPILCALFDAHVLGLTLAERFALLPKRFSRAALLPNFPQAVGRRIVAEFSGDGAEVRERLQKLMPSELGLGNITRIDHTDGVRMTFASGDVIHFRPSGNADELRVYAVADTEERAETLAARGIAEPDGILRTLAKSFGDRLHNLEITGRNFEVV